MNTLKDLLSPEMRNILEKYSRLGFLTQRMGIAKTKVQDPIFILNKIEDFRDHNDYEEVKNLCIKLTKIDKK